MSLLRAAVLGVRPAMRAPVRRFSGGHDAAEAAAEMVRWEKFSYVAFGVSGLFGLYMAYVEYQHSKHPHEVHKPEMSHLKIRSKEYPWRCPDCNLFDLKCWRECKAALKAAKE
eukprot:CAMPEP_0118919706 /NCGR_PEP_ID=MMETSP1166-20130328/18695_1 /TAXON_ID=1104430 /ORGANISM="Chrysoreinhardia sp, Strain CCMP3193" /LENGTH=112 /DNA_ID=CAMNT_0006860235 /DNA_START=30 /DNA_END=368 /DNA_ORIENTATION=+